MTRRPPISKVELGLLFVGLIFVFAIYFVVMFGALFITAALAEPLNHDLHHAQYQNWQSNAGFNCCNNQDCGELPDKDVRANGDHYEVKVDDEWCPVTFEHLTRTGASPDWSRNHACILSTASGLTPCQRFKCFKGKVEL